MIDNKLGADYTVSPKMLKKYIKTMAAIRQPVLVLGQPGSAKSSIMKQVAEETGREYIDIRPLLLNPVELHGLPRIDEVVVMRWSRPYFPPELRSSIEDVSYVIIAENYRQPCLIIQIALYQLMLGRRCGEYELPKGASVVAHGKRRKS